MKACCCWPSPIANRIWRSRSARRSATENPKAVGRRRRHSALKNPGPNNSGLARGGHHDPDQIGGIPRPELLHDIGAVVLDGTRTDPEMPSRFLVGRAGGELLEHLAFPARQWLASGTMQRRDPGRRRTLGP